MKFDFFWIKAKVFLFDKNCGGLDRTVKTFYHPNLVFGYNQSIFRLYDKSKQRFILKEPTKNLAKIVAKDGLFFIEKTIEAGVYRECIIRGILPVNKDLVNPDTEFLIREGSWVIGIGNVISLVEPNSFKFIHSKYY